VGVGPATRIVRYILARMRRLRLLLATAILLAGCAAAGSGTTTTAATTVATPTTTTAPAGDLPPCLAGDAEFGRSGVVAAFGDELDDAVQIASIRQEGYDGCERVAVDFLTGDGAPAATLGPTAADFRPEAGIVRITLPGEVTASAIADLTFDGTSIRRAFVVRTRDGDLAVDLHLAAAAVVVVRSMGTRSPAQVFVDVKPDAEGIARTDPPAIGDNVVVLSPGAGPITYPITITGYARTFEGNVVARLIAEDGTVATEESTTAADWLDAWGEFALTLTDGPTGPVVLFVGEDSPEDGHEVGVRLDLEVP